LKIVYEIFRPNAKQFQPKNALIISIEIFIFIKNMTEIYNQLTWGNNGSFEEFDGITL